MRSANSTLRPKERLNDRRSSIRSWRPIAFLLALLLLLQCPLPARAHAVLLEHTPAENAQLLSSPVDVKLRFDEAVTPVVVRVLDSSGRSLTVDADVSVVDETVSIRLPKDLPTGGYVVSYRVISADSHPVAGSFVFSVGASTGGATLSSAIAASDGPAWNAIAAGLRTLFYVTFLFAAGGSLFLLFVDYCGPVAFADRRRILAACAAAAVLLCLALGVEGAAGAGAAFSQFFDLATWRIGLRTTMADSAGLTIAGLAALALGLYRAGSRLAWSVALAGTLLAVAGFGLTGHVATTEPRWVTAPALVLHVLCDAFWVGALLPLYLRLGADGGNAAVPIIVRFSRIALYVVPVLFASGLTIAVVQVRAPSALVETAYGRIFVVKLTLFAALFALAALNKLRLAPALDRGVSGGSRRLRLSIVCEAALIVGILVATSLIGQQIPPRALAMATHQHADSSTQFARILTSGKSRLSLDVHPLLTGDNELVMVLTKDDGTPMAPLELSIHLSSPERGIEDSDHKARSTGPGRYSANLTFPVPGVWNIEIDALVTDFDSAGFTTTVTIR